MEMNLGCSGLENFWREDKFCESFWCEKINQIPSSMPLGINCRYGHRVAAIGKLFNGQFLTFQHKCLINSLVCPKFMLPMFYRQSLFVVVSWLVKTNTHQSPTPLLLRPQTRTPWGICYFFKAGKILLVFHLHPSTVDSI